MLGYIDPGSGSMMIQIIAGSIIGGLFFLKTSWGNLKLIVRKTIHNLQQNAGISGK